MGESRIIVFILILVATLTGLDLIKDLGEGVSPTHALIETAIIVLCSIGIFLFIRQMQLEKRSLSSSLRQTREDLRFWKEKSGKFIQGLSLEIEKQFSQWGLTKSEKEIALMLVKGYSTKEVAAFRKTTEKTVRVQTSSIYKKASVNNRNELAAFFLEDLLMPTSE